MATTRKNGEEHVKSSLVQVRNVIADKYRKLHRTNLMREKELQKRYAPITKTIGKLVQTKELVSKVNERLKNPEMKYEPMLKDIKLKFDRDDNDDGGAANAEQIPHFANFGNYAANTAADDMEMEIDESDPNSDDVAKNDPGSKLSNDCANNPIEGKNRSNCKEQSIKSYSKNRKKVIDSIGVVSKKSKSMKRDIDAIRNVEQLMTHENISGEIQIRENAKKGRKKRVVLSPEDYDSNGKFVGLAPKRRKIEVKKRVPTIIVSPEDFGIDGHFEGLADKRRKVEIPSDILPTFTRQIAQQKQKDAATERRNRRIAARNQIQYGTGLEHKFIPLAENIVYEYYDNPNELCDRLRLLLSSKGAGNTNHDQEINSIIEELRERHIIK